LTEHDPEGSGGAVDPPEAGSAPAGSLRIFRHLDRFFEHKGTKRLVSVCEVIGAIGVMAGAIAGIAHLTGPSGSDNAGGSAPPATGTTVPTTAPPSAGPSSSSPPPAPASSTAALPRCWTAGRILIDCRENHQFEEIPGATQCSQATIIAFMGGRTDLDVTLARPAKSPLGSCAADAGHELAISAKDVLTKASSASWRRCNDGRIRKIVACSELHSSEYFATGSLRRATTEECEVAAVQYMDQTPANVVDELQIRALNVVSNSPDPARCAIDARGNHLLVDSVRNLGSRPVPIYSS
jgi:hypothetical protein